MRKGGGKQKGASFERLICKELSLWISKGLHEDVFWRSAMSGGRSTVAKGKGKQLGAQAGDISCIHPIGHDFAKRFFVECKFYKDLNLEGLITESGNLFKFWMEASIQAHHYGKEPVLIAKQNRGKTLVCLTAEGANKLISSEDLLLSAPPINIHIFDFRTLCGYSPPTFT